MPIYEITADRLVELQQTTFSSHGLRERGDLQGLLRDQTAVIAPDVLIIAKRGAVLSAPEEFQF